MASFVLNAARQWPKRLLGGIQGAIWTFGIAVLAVTGWWWPGIMVLVGLSAILGAITRNNRRQGILTQRRKGAKT